MPRRSPHDLSQFADSDVVRTFRSARHAAGLKACTTSDVLSRSRGLRVLVLCLLGLTVVHAQPATDSPLYGPALFKAIRWRSIGPYRGGRVTAVPGVAGQPHVYYMGATGGGVWKTDDGGITWDPITDGFVKTGSVGAIAVAPSDPNVIYVGMGEACIRSNFSHGDGVYKSVDAGQHVEARRPRRLPPDRQDRRPPAEPRHRVRRRAGTSVRTEPGARPVPHARRRRDLGESAVCRRHDRRRRRRHRPVNPRNVYASFWPVYRRPWEIYSGGRRQRSVQVRGRRQHVDRVEERPAGGHEGADRPRRLADPSRSRVGDRRSEGRRRVPIGRRAAPPGSG